MREETVKALQELAKVVGGPDAVISHINFGESEDYMRGFNLGYDDCEAGAPDIGSVSAPNDEPWRGAYLRGYRAGWECWLDQEADQP